MLMPGMLDEEMAALDKARAGFDRLFLGDDPHHRA